MINPISYEILPYKGTESLYAFTKPNYDLTIRITDFCNYKCHYCQWHYGKHYELSDIKQSLSTVVDITKYDNYRIYFHGGEPTSHPKLFEVLDYCFSLPKGIVCELQTNLSRNEAYLIKLIDRVAGKQFEVSASYHPTQAKDFNEFINKLDLLHANKVLGKIDVMLDHDSALRDTIINNCNQLLKRDYSDRIEFIHSYINYPSVSHLYSEYVNTGSKFSARYKVTDSAGTRICDTNDLYKEGINFTGWKCQVGKQYIILNGNGDYYMCCSNMLDNVPAGNLIKNPGLFKIRTKAPTICKWKSCHGEFYIEKTK